MAGSKQRIMSVTKRSFIVQALLRVNARAGYNHLRRSTPARPMTPEANSMKLPGSGVVPLPPPLMVNDSEGIVPTELSEAFDGQPFDMQPRPLFSSQ